MGIDRAVDPLYVAEHGAGLETGPCGREDGTGRPLSAPLPPSQPALSVNSTGHGSSVRLEIYSSKSSPPKGGTTGLTFWTASQLDR